MRSLMFVPSKSKMLAKIPASDADVFIIDLEDSINEACKQQALEDACEFLPRISEKNVYIRVDVNHLDEEFKKLSGLSFSGYMIPKFERPDDFAKYMDYFEQKDVIALVETPIGIVNIEKIASCSFVSVIAFGAEDFTSSIGMKNFAEGLNYARSTIVTYGRAFGKKVIDTPSFIIDDIEALDKEIQIAVDMGFDGKLAIHPKQVGRINELFQCFNLDSIKSIVEQYDASGEAVLKVGNKVYEKMHIAHFKRILKEHGIN